MAQRFEDLTAWQRARARTTRVCVITREGQFSRDFGLATQLERASVSVMANLAEGCDRNRITEFARFIEISRGSAAEVLSHLYVAQDIGYLSAEQSDDLANDTRAISRLRTRLLEGVRRKPGSQQGQLAEEVAQYEAETTLDLKGVIDPEQWAVALPAGTRHRAPGTGH